jgi:hypothetical protein
MVTDLNARRQRDDDERHRAWLRQRIANLEDMQRRRIETTQRKKAEMDRVIELKDAEIANLRAQLEVS